MRRQVIFDTDPSPDDAVAFLAALASPEEFEVLAITTVAGNVPVELNPGHRFPISVALALQLNPPPGCWLAGGLDLSAH